MVAPGSQAFIESPHFPAVSQIVQARCPMCHSATPAWEGVAEAPPNPLVREPARIPALESPDGVPFRLLRSPIRLPGEEVPARPGPKLGADTDDVLEALGYDRDRIASLRDRGIV